MISKKRNNLKIATILPYKENYTSEKASAASLWVAEFFKNSKFRNNNTIYGYTKSKNYLTKNYLNINLKSINSNQFIHLIKKNKYDLIVSYSCPQIINNNTLNMIKKLNIKLVNFHPGILPKYRGIFTNFYSLKNKEVEVGITLHKISKKIDSGEILSIFKIPIEANDTIYDLYKKIYLSQDSLKFVANSIKNYKKIRKKISISNKSYKYNSYPDFIDILKYRIKKL